jgi:hypothetical protein
MQVHSCYLTLQQPGVWASSRSQLLSASRQLPQQLELLHLTPLGLSQQHAAQLQQALTHPRTQA